MVFAIILNADTKDILKRFCNICENKLTKFQNAIFFCSSCNVESNPGNTIYSYRMFLTLKVEGKSNLLNVAAFDRIVEQLIGMDANKYALVIENEERISKLFECRLIGKWIDVDFNEFVVVKMNFISHQEHGEFPLFN